MPDLYYDGAKVSPESPLGKELLKWEKPHNWRPDAPENRYPRAMYKAQVRPDGRWSTGEVLDSLCGGQPGAAVQFTKSCFQEAKNEEMENRLFEAGYRRTQEEALALLEKKQDNISDLAAERAFLESKMSELAQREAAIADKEAGLKQLPEVKEKPLDKAGAKRARAKKGAAAAA